MSASSSGVREDGTASIARNAGLSFAANIATAGFTALITLYLVRALDPDGYGIVALAVGFASLALLPTDFGITPSTARFVAEHRGDNRAVAAVLFKALRIKLALGAVMSVLVILLAEPIASLYDEPELVWPLRAVAIALFGQSLVYLFSNVFVALGRVSGSFVLILAEASSEAIATIGLVLIAGTATAAMAGRAVGYTIGAIVGVVLLFRFLGRTHISERRGGPTSRRLAVYAGALLIVDSVYAVFTQVDILLVGIIVGTTAAGVYGAPVKLVVLLGYPGVAISNAISPRLARRSGEKPDVGALLTGLRLLILLQAMMAAVLLVWAEPIVDLVLGAGYEGSVPVVRALAGLVLLSGLGPLVSVSVNYLGEARRRVPITIFCLVLHVVATIVLVHAMGIAGAAISVDVAYAIYVLAHLRICSQLLNFSVRPLGGAALSALLSAIGAGLVLFAFGTADLSAVEWVLGLVGASAVYLAIAVGTRGTSLTELRWLGTRARAAVHGAG